MHHIHMNTRADLNYFFLSRLIFFLRRKMIQSVTKYSIDDGAAICLNPSSGSDDDSNKQTINHKQSITAYNVRFLLRIARA